MDEKTAVSKPVVVAYDGSPDADRALRFGVELSRGQRLPLRVVIARGDAHKLSRWADEWTRGLAEEWAECASKILAGEGEGPAVVIIDGRAADVLVAESPEAHVVLIGAQGHGRTFAALNGSVSQHVVRHAACPVIVVREEADATSGRVVVGVDGSAPSLEALEFALHYAGQHDLRLEVFHVPEHWQPFAFEDPATQGPELARDVQAEDERVLRSAADVIARHPGVDVHMEQREGSASRVLVEASSSAQLVVVGSRGQGAFAGLLLGSVSADVLHHAHCSVAVTR